MKLRAVLLLGWCVTVVSAVSTWAQSPEVSRQEVLATARTYQTFTWVPTARNVLHGYDHARVRVDTPDVSLHRAGTRSQNYKPYRYRRIRD